MAHQTFLCGPDGPVVQTKAGKLRGFQFGSICHFYGVDYAKAERWQQPRPVEPWEVVKDATMVLDEKCEVKVDFDRELSACHKAMKYVPQIPNMNF